MYHAAQHDDKALAPLPFVASVTAMMDARATAYSTVMIGISAPVSVGRIRRMRDDEGCQLVAGQSGERPRAQSQSVHGGH